MKRLCRPPNVIGKVFGRLIVLLRGADTPRGASRWLCRCECGKHILAQIGNLRTGHTKSCGCLKREAAMVHGLSGSAEYQAWANMIQRCHNPGHPHYANYGGRGITVCDRWITSFATFARDTGKRPSTAHSLEREDNNKGYEPGNVIWATRRAQARNTRLNHWIEIDGVSKLIGDWAVERDIDVSTICHRIARGMSERDAVLMPPRFGGRRASKKVAA